MRWLGVFAGSTLALMAVLTACESALDLGRNGVSRDAGDGASDHVSGPLQDPDGGSDGALADGAPSDAGRDGDSTLDAEAGAVKRLFATRTRYGADFGGIAGGDFRCQASADAVPLGGTFKAWLSDSTTNAADRFVSDGPWVEVGSGVLLFSSRAALRGFPQALIRRDELGGFAKARWWTGTLANGLKAPSNCENWTTNSGFERGLIGICGPDDEPVGQDWTQWQDDTCAESNSLLCLED